MAKGKKVNYWKIINYFVYAIVIIFVFLATTTLPARASKREKKMKDFLKDLNELIHLLTTSKDHKQFLGA